MVNVGNELNTLYHSRFLRTEKEVDNFENALNNIMSIKDASLIPEMCKAFEDNTENKEVMYGLIHAVEFFEGKEYFLGLARAFPHMISKSKMWLKILYFGILNDKASLNEFTKVLPTVEKPIKDGIITVLKEIKNEKPKLFSASVDELLKVVNHP